MALLTGTLPAQTAGGGTSTTYIGTAEIQDASSLQVQSVTVTAPAGYTTVTGAATNNYTINVRQMRANASVGTIATLTGASGVNLVAETPVNIPITASYAVQPNDTFDVQLVQNASGLAINVGLIVEVDLG